MIGVANTKHLGRPLFGGTTGTDQAFDPNGTYIGDDGAIERTVMDGLTVQVNVTGEQVRSEEHTSELQSLMRISYAVFCLKTKNNPQKHHQDPTKTKANN